MFVAAALATGRPLAPDRIPAAAWPYLVAIGFVSTFLAIQTFYAGRPTDRRGAGRARQHGRAADHRHARRGSLLDDVLAPIQLVGAGLIIVGVLIAQTGPGQRERRRRPRRRLVGAEPAARQPRARRERALRAVADERPVGADPDEP